MAPLFHPNQVIVMCGICVTVTGKILHFFSVSYPWNVIDSISDSDVICTVFVNSAQEIIDSIEKWNRNRPYCLQDVNSTTGDDAVLALQTVKNNVPSQKIIDDTFSKSGYPFNSATGDAAIATTSRSNKSARNLRLLKR